ncbi:DUF1624 domain-containing protein [Pleionea litopenaei]|uniref:Heparan-alpha-glucosaminide N-acetyltransferase domain-containing protein n=1 Tax=Pleionea litopenaei TaxID=3070815 RepID=A0AA51X6F5_9GAMM|nr:heparan-alpha-glucosaminide N-acetyltransferase domain-containing protein [Pleionea sp. HL-JVS1]WMS86799.1 heparan-alpha-glucosaminide N-acetyltransferase domain-containing protein [Pleionea sp. HL-JVS1]
MTAVAIDNVVEQRKYRIENIDFLRGLVIVIMAIDHVRDYLGAGVVAQAPMSDDASLGTYLTRLVTHLCAPIFVFLAGTSAGLMTARRSPRELSYFLITRGLWLIVIELAVVSQLWTFNITGLPFLGGLTGLAFQVIGAIGLSMMVLGLLQFLGARACLAIGILIVIGHNALDSVWPVPQMGQQNIPLWVGLHAQMGFAIGQLSFYIAYPPIPWIGIMLMGFGTASLFNRTPVEQKRLFLLIGLSLLVIFFVLRGSQIYGDPNTWQAQANGWLTLRDFFNVTKYPPSLLFTLLTLGVGCLILTIADHLPRLLRSIMITFGKAPFAIYIAHLLIIHSLSVLFGMYQGFEAEQFLTMYFLFPEGFGVGLLGVYGFWLCIMVALYPLAKWVSDVKSRRKDWWLSYL